MKFENSATGASKIRTMQYSVPETLASYIDLIDPTVFLGKTVAAVCQLFNGLSSQVLIRAGPNKSNQSQEGDYSHQTLN